MTYSVEDRDDTNSAVYDGARYIGLVVKLGGAYLASKAGSDDDETSFDAKADAVEWLVAEFRDVPWADRSEAIRV